MLEKIITNKYIFSLTTKFIIVGLGLFDTVFINRYLGPSLKGEYAYLLNIINILALVLNLGVYQAYPYFKRNQGMHDLKNKFFNMVLIQFFFYLLIALTVSLILQNQNYTIMLTLVPLMILTNQLLFISMVENINLRNKLNIGNQILYTIMLFCIYKFAPLNYLYVLILLYVKDIIVVIRILKKFNFKFSMKGFSFDLFKNSVKFGIHPMFTALLITMNYKFDVILLKQFVSFEQIGLYTVGVGLADKIWIIPDAFKDVLFSKTAKDDSIEDIVLSVKVNLIISIGIIILVAILGRSIILLLYGSDFIESYYVTLIIFLGTIPMIFFKMINTLFIAKGKQKLSFNILLLSVIINIVGNLILIPQLGISGAAASSVISYTACGLLFVNAFTRDYKIKLLELLILSKQEIRRIKKIIAK